jgi:uncharacterized protein (TIGR03067 family)
MRMLTRIASVLAVTLVMPAVDQRANASAREGPAELQGTWKLVSLEINGTATAFTDAAPRWVIKGNKVRYGGAELASLTSDATATPKIIDLEFLTPKKAYEGIYTVEKDTLQICFSTQTEGAKERPQVFSTKDREDWRLLVFQRDKPQQAGAKEGLNGFVGIQLRLDADRKEVVVEGFVDGSPAKGAGMQKDDVIVKVAGEEAADLHTVVNAVRRARPGSVLSFQVRRGGEEKEITVKVGVMPFAILARLE